MGPYSTTVDVGRAVRQTTVTPVGSALCRKGPRMKLATKTGQVLPGDPSSAGSSNWAASRFCPGFKSNHGIDSLDTSLERLPYRLTENNSRGFSFEREIE